MYTFLNFAFFILFLSNCASEKKVNSKHLNGQISDSTLSVIKSIDSIGNVYVIYIERKDSILKLVSEKKKFDGCNRIQIGKSYSLKIKSLMENFSSKRHINGVDYMGTRIYLDEKFGAVWDIFISWNLSGLCYIPFENELE